MNLPAMPRIACLGEMLLRLSTPATQTLAQATSLALHAGGAEANVAVALARAGHDVSMLTLLADNELGWRCRDELRRHGVNIQRCELHPGRMGLYFLMPGVGQRAAQVIYDRFDSVFGLQAPEVYASPDALSGIDLLHVSGVTAALSARHAEMLPALLQRAAAQGIQTSFDCNFRAKLWQRWPSDPGRCLQHCAQHAQVLFADARSLALILGDAQAGQRTVNDFAALSQQAMSRYPQLEYIACTQRIELSANHHRLGACMRTRQELLMLEPVEVTPIVDRIGTGDAFAAGLLHGLLHQLADRDTLAFARSAAVLKHSVAGDFNLVSTTMITQQHEAGLSVQR